MLKRYNGNGDIEKERNDWGCPVPGTSADQADNRGLPSLSRAQRRRSSPRSPDLVTAGLGLQAALAVLSVVALVIPSLTLSARGGSPPRTSPDPHSAAPVL